MRRARVRGEMNMCASFEGLIILEGPTRTPAEEETWVSPWGVRGMSLWPV